MTLYELIMTSPILSDNVKKKLIEQIAANKISKEDIEKIIKILVKNKEKLDWITMKYIENLDKIYAKKIKNEIKRIELKEKKVERFCKEIKQKTKDGNPEELLKDIE